MNPRLPLLLIATVAANSAFAGCGNGPSYLTLAQVNTVLTSHFACGKSSALNPPGWNELHSSGGTLQEQHEGGTTVENVGTWSTADIGNSRGRVTYSYTGGTVFVYEVAVHANGNCNTGPPPNCTTLPQAYDFCRVSPDTTAFSIFVSTSFQAPPSPGAMNASCPTNP